MRKILEQNHNFLILRHERKGGDLRDRLHLRREGPGNDPNRHRDRDHRNRGDHRRSESGGSGNRNVTIQNPKPSLDHSKIDKGGNSRQTSKDEELRRKRQQMEEETHRMEIKVRRKRERSKDRDRSRHTSHGTEKHHRTSSDHSKNKKGKKQDSTELEEKKGQVDILQAVEDAVAAADADQHGLRSGEEDVSSDEKEGESGESEEGSNESR